MEAVTRWKWTIAKWQHDIRFSMGHMSLRDSLFTLAYSYSSYMGLLVTTATQSKEWKVRRCSGRRISGQCEETTPAQKHIMSFSMSSDRWRYMCWREANLKWSSASLQDFFFFLLHLRVWDTHTHAHNKGTEKQRVTHVCSSCKMASMSCRQRSEQLRAHMLHWLPALYKITKKQKLNKTKKEKASFSAFVHILSSGS